MHYKRAIEDHFDANNESESMLRANGNDAQADMVRNILPEGVECIFVCQAEQLGLGHEVLSAERAVNGPTVVTSASHSSQETVGYATLYNPAETISAGSSLKFCRIAEGRADIYPRLGRTMEWDTAVAHAVLKAAGGNLVELKNKSELRHGKPGMENMHFVATSEACNII